MSFYTDMSAAARFLIAHPEHLSPADYEGVAGILTEIDVMLLASKTKPGGYSQEDMSMVGREASQVMGHFFRQGFVFRYGPVQLPELDYPDYLRHDGKIIYAGPDGPQKILTPNGAFPRFDGDHDPITRVGRRLGTSRTDLLLWGPQDIFGADSPGQLSSEESEIIRLKGRVASLEAELDGYRQGNGVLAREG